MSSLIETMNNMAVQWSDGMWLIVWQSTGFGSDRISSYSMSAACLCGRVFLALDARAA